MAENSPRTESTYVRRCAYAAFTGLFLWLVYALASHGEFAAPLVGTIVGLILVVPMYMREVDAEAVRLSRQAADQRHEGRSQGTSRWNVEDNSDPTTPPPPPATVPQPRVVSTYEEDRS